MVDWDSDPSDYIRTAAASSSAAGKGQVLTPEKKGVRYLHSPSARPTQKAAAYSRKAISKKMADLLETLCK